MGERRPDRPRCGLPQRHLDAAPRWRHHDDDRADPGSRQTWWPAAGARRMGLRAGVFRSHGIRLFSVARSRARCRRDLRVRAQIPRAIHILDSEGVPLTAMLDAVVVGAGPYGLLVGAHLLGGWHKVAVFGRPFAMWLQ